MKSVKYRWCYTAMQSRALRENGHTQKKKKEKTVDEHSDVSQR